MLLQQISNSENISFNLESKVEKTLLEAFPLHQDMVYYA